MYMVFILEKNITLEELEYYSNIPKDKLNELLYGDLKYYPPEKLKFQESWMNRGLSKIPGDEEKKSFKNAV